jgi:hypothetical protein
MNQNKKRGITQLARARGLNQPEPAREGNQPSPYLFPLSLTARQDPPIGSITSPFLSLLFLLMETAGRRLLPRSLRAVNGHQDLALSTPDPLSHPLFFAQELTARPHIWSPESADVDAVRH